MAAQVKLLVAGEFGYRWLEMSKSWWLERLGTVLVAGEAKLFVAEKGPAKLLMAGAVGVLLAWVERLGPAG